MASFIYNSAAFDEANGDIDYGADTFYGMLLTDAYTPDRQNHTRRSDISAEEAIGAGYTLGGNQIMVTVAQDNPANQTIMTFGAVSWSAATLAARYEAIYKASGAGEANDPLVALIDFGATQSTSGQTFPVAASTITKQT